MRENFQKSTIQIIDSTSHILMDTIAENDRFTRETDMNRLKGIVHQLRIYNIFFVPQQKKHFSLKVHLDKTTLT